MLRGWISSPVCVDADVELLEEMGVKVGEYNPDKAQWDNCEVSDEAFAKLEPTFGYFIWGLE